MWCRSTARRRLIILLVELFILYNSNYDIVIELLWVFIVTTKGRLAGPRFSCHRGALVLTAVSLAAGSGSVSGLGV